MFGLWGSLSAFGGYGGPGACYRPFGPIRPRGFVVGCLSVSGAVRPLG